MEHEDLRELDETQIIEPSENGATASPESVLEVLRARRREHAEQRSFDADVPGYGGQLVLRLGPLPGATLTRLRERIERSRSPERDVNLNADMLLAACRVVCVRARLANGELGRPMELLDEHEQPVRIDERLAERLSMDVEGARPLLFAIFSLANSPEVAISTLAGSYMEWAASASSDADEEFLGES